jgi:hypothetical protein
MRLQPTPPSVPLDLVNQFGEPEDTFGPNLRFRVASTILGAVLVLLGLAFFVNGAAVVAGQGQPGGPLYLLLGGGLMAVGAAAVALPWRVARTWVFVCPRGLVRARGSEWDAVGWEEVARFEDATLADRAVQQCRVVLKGGGEWGFLAEYVADYHRLGEVLRRKVDERDAPRAPTYSSAAKPGGAPDTRRQER